jgi:hypothetical protein
MAKRFIIIILAVLFLTFIAPIICIDETIWRVDKNGLNEIHSINYLNLLGIYFIKEEGK